MSGVRVTRKRHLTAENSQLHRKSTLPAHYGVFVFLIRRPLYIHDFCFEASLTSPLVHKTMALITLLSEKHSPLWESLSLLSIVAFLLISVGNMCLLEIDQLTEYIDNDLHHRSCDLQFILSPFSWVSGSVVCCDIGCKLRGVPTIEISFLHIHRYLALELSLGGRRPRL